MNYVCSFEDGPAARAELTLGRAPILLRVAVSPSGKIDALDQLNDEAKPREKLYVYWLIRRGESVTHLDYHTPGGQRRGMTYATATYQLYPAWESTRPVLRCSRRWIAWCEANKDRIHEERRLHLAAIARHVSLPARRTGS